MDAVPAAGWLVDHRLLDGVDAIPGRRIGAGISDIFTTVCVTGEPFVGDALALWPTIGAGVAEAAVVHVPTVQTRSRGQGLTPGVGVEASCGPIAIDDIEESLCELALLVAQRWRLSIGCRVPCGVAPFEACRCIRSTIDGMGASFCRWMRYRCHFVSWYAQWRGYSLRMVV